MISDVKNGEYVAVDPSLNEMPGASPLLRDRDGSTTRPRLAGVHGYTVAAIALCLGIGLLLVVVVLVPIRLTSMGPLSGNMRTLYATGITVLATLYTTFLIRQLRALLLLGVDRHLKSQKSVKFVDPKWRTVMGTASLTEQIGNLHSTLLLLAAGLSTAAIVGALVPTQTTRTVLHEIPLPNDDSYLCASTYSQQEGAQIAGLQWTLPNESLYLVQPNMQFCPTSAALATLGSINAINPEQYGYQDQGIAVSRGAIGAPASIYASQANVQLPSAEIPGFNNTLIKYGASLVSSSQCVPVMTKNPVQCMAAPAVLSNGTVSVQGPGGCLAVLDTNLAQVSGQFCVYGELGQATAVLVTAHGMSMFLAEAVADYDWLAKADTLVNWTLEESVYGVVCDIDAHDIYEYRQVVLSLHEDPTHAGGFARVLDTQNEETCRPGPETIDSDPTQHKLPATAAAAAWALMRGDTIITSARQLLILPYPTSSVHSVYVRKPPFGFADSRNGLEDVLGLSAALVAAQVGLTDGTDSWMEPSMLDVVCTRIGTGNTWAMVYVLPNLIMLGLLGYFMFATWSENRVEALSASLAGLAQCFENRARA